METGLFSRFEPLLRSIDLAGLKAEIDHPDRLLVESAKHRSKTLEIAYAPFDHIAADARIVIVGITPGRQQMRNALCEIHKQLRRGRSGPEALAAAKVFASFSGPMRSNLVDMLDTIGVQRLLGLTSAGSLWKDGCGLAHFTSVLRYPVFISGANYSGQPSMLRTPVLRAQLEQWLVPEIRQLPEAIFVPLGPKVAEALEFAARIAGLSSSQILSGLPHPSGANNERIAYLLGRKRSEDLSTKTDPDRLDAVRENLHRKVAMLSKANPSIPALTGLNQSCPMRDPAT